MPDNPSLKRTCCICAVPMRAGELGCNPEPFTGRGENPRACQDCDDRFVTPVRALFGHLASKQLLQILASMAKEGRRIVEAKSIGRQMFAVNAEEESGED